MSHVPSARVSDFINLSRWLAASVVAGGHIRQLLFADYDRIQVHSPVWSAFYFLTQFGHEAVMVFFVISGYLIGGIAINRYPAKGFSLADYTIHRFARIYTTLLPTLLLFGLIDLAGSHLFAGTGLYASNIKMSSMGHRPVDALGVRDFLGNAAMLQTVLVPTLGSNGPLWSLANEWWYYCLFGAGMTAIVGGGWIRKAIALAAFVALVLLLPFAITSWGVMWLLGAGVAIYGRREMWKPALWLSIPVAALILFVSRLSHTGGSIGQRLGHFAFAIDLAVAIGFALVLLSMHRPGERSRVSNLHHRLADFSYSLYLIHFPAMMAFVGAGAAWFGLPFQRQPGLGTLAYALLIFALVFATAWGFGRLVEARTGAVRNRLTMLFAHRPAAY